MPYDQVNEDSTAYVTFAFLDSAGSAAVPSGAVTWDVWDKTSGRLVASGSESASSSITVTMDDTCTPILLASNDVELRELVVRAPYSTQSFTERHLFQVVNMRGPLTYRIVKGDSYLNADSRALRVTCGKGVPDLDGTVSLYFEGDSTNDDTLGPIAGVIVDAAGNNKDMRFDVTATQTDSLSAADYTVTVYATQASGSKLTISKGKATVIDKAT